MKRFALIITFIFLTTLCLTGVVAQDSQEGGGSRQKLRLTSMCSPEPEHYRVWRVRNETHKDVSFTWQVYDSSQNGAGSVPARGEVFFTTQTEPGANTTVIHVNGKQQDLKASNPAACHPTATPAPTETSIPTLTPEPVPPTATDVPTLTPTDAPTETPIPTATLEPAPPTATPTKTPPPCARNGRLDCSSLKVSAHCDGKTAVFTIRNTGEPGNGDMVAPTQWRLYVNGQLMETGEILLAGGASMQIRYSNGGQANLEADQQIGHPGNSRPNACITCSSWVKPTNTPTFVPTVMPTVTPSFTPTFTQVPPTVTPSFTPTFTQVPPTVTPSFTPTFTQVPPTVTPSFTPTFTQVPPTVTPSFTPTFTQVPPSVTPSFTPTFTQVPPTVTPSFTPTFTQVPPTVTPSFTPTFTQVPPTLTPTPISPECTFSIPPGNVYQPGGLIEAINAANASPNPDIICLTPGSTYTLLTLNAVASGLPPITTPITVLGFNATITRLSTAANFRIFRVEASGALSLQNLTLSGGRTNTGGAISNNGLLNVTSTTFADNVGVNSGGAIYNDRGTVTISGTTFQNNSSANGGALYNFATEAQMTITNSQVFSSTASNLGGGLFNFSGTANISGTTFTGNNASRGGAIFNSQFGTVSVSNSVLNLNNATNDGGGIATDSINAQTNNSCLANNTGASGRNISSSAAGTVNMENNWWGRNGGPNANEITGNVDFIPFLNTPPAICGGLFAPEQDDSTPWVERIIPGPLPVDIQDE